MKKKSLIIIAILIVIVLFGSLIFPLISKGRNGNNTDNNPGKASIEETESRIPDSTERPAESGTSADETEKAQEAETSDGEDSAIEKGEDSSSGNGGGGGGQGSPGETTGETTGKTGDEDPQQASQSQGAGSGSTNIPTISFPYTITGSDLVVERIQSYSGYFIEDGSDKDVSEVAAIVLKNNGGDLGFAGIGISQGTRSLGFSASQIPAGATMIILEQNGATFSSDPYYSATATTQPVEKFEMSEELVTVKDNGDNSLSVTNISDKMLSEIKVFYKNYLPEEDVYVGGITYTIKVTDLEPGATMTVSASHYDSEYGVVVEVLAE